jgi:hypothetical protein
MRAVITAWLALLLLAAASVSYAQLSMMGIGPASSGSALNCGTGVIDASTGCTLPMLGS